MSRHEDMDNIIKQVEGWSPNERISLAQALLNTLPTKPIGPMPSLADLVGVGSGSGTPPTDEQVKSWIEEHRQRKYG